MNLDLFTPSQLPYPAAVMAQGGCQQTQVASLATLAGGGAYQSAPRDGLFNSIFTPDDLPYPLPIMQQRDACVQQSAGGSGQCGCAQQSANQLGASLASSNVQQSPPAQASTPVQSPTPAQPTTSSPPSGSQAAAPPSTIVINVGVPASSTSAAQASTPAATGAPSSSDTQAQPDPVTPPATPPVAPVSSASLLRMPAMLVSGGSPPRPSDVIVQAYSYNPRLRARVPKAQEELLEELLNEKITMKMLSVSGTPVAFVVPDGCNAADFFVGAIEVNPDIGSTEDLDFVIATGAPKLSSNGQPAIGALSSGDQITVTLPWRYASWVELAQDHLRASITARFFTIENQ